MNEIDISEKVKGAIKFGLPVLLALSVAVASVVWYAVYGTGDLVVRDAKVSSSMVGARVRVAGTVAEVLVQDGDVVKAGDVIARIKVNVTEEQLKQLQQTVELSQQNLDQIKKGVTVRTPRVVSAPPNAGASAGEVERARNRMERMNQLYEMGAISAVKRDEAAAAYQAAVAAASAAPSYDSSVIYDTTVQAASPETIKRAELQLRQAQAALERAKGNAAATEITAPVDGIVYIGDLAEGMEVQAGQVVANVGNSDSMWIEAYLKPQQQGSVRLGQVADFYVDRKKYEGLVMEIYSPAENAAGEAAPNTEGSYGENSSGKLVVRISISPEDVAGMSIGDDAEVRFLKKG
ncbi:MAG: HlyD family efflux transporter periplasmic adaptor subunit [Selenomonadaceae bacterium]|nr:HlyD family efflux transporter periplasmic adaptor subunit [Selenomonadaceae bacterium]